MQRAARLGIKVSDEMLNETLTDVAQRNNIKFSDLPAALEAQGVDYRSLPRGNAPRDDARTCCASATSTRASTCRRARSTSASPSARTRPATTRNTTSRTSWSRCRASATPEQVEERATRAQGVYERARARRGLRPARDRLFRRRHRARGRRARLAQGRTSCRRSRRTSIPRLKPGEVTRADPHAERPPHLQAASTCAAPTRRRMVSQVHARHILHADQRPSRTTTPCARSCCSIRERILKGEDFEAIASVNSDDPGSAAQRRRPRLGRPGHLRAGIRAGSSTRSQDNEISQPFKTAVRLAHRAAARPPHVRRHRRRDPQPLRGRSCARRRPTRKPRSGLRRLRDEAFVEYRL